MQSDAGYPYPSNRILWFLNVISICATVVVWYAKCLSILQAIALLFGLEGTALLAASYSPVGLTPPQGNLRSKFKWFFKVQKGTSVSFDPRMFYGGFFCLFISYIINGWIS